VGFDIPGGQRVRIMEPTNNAPLRASFTNSSDQPISPFTGKQPKTPHGMKGSAAKQYIRERTHVELS
jgi:hypothetical protein